LAEQWYAAGTQDPALGIRLKDIRASLYGSQQHYGVAVELLEEVYRGRKGLADRNGAARALVGKGVFTAYLGRLDEAFHLFDEALDLLGSSQESELREAILHNKIHFLTDACRFDEALNLLMRHRSDLWEWGGNVSRYKLLDVEGRIQAGLGHLDLAESLFRQSKEGFRSSRIIGHEALAGLHLSTVVLRQDRSRYSEAVALAVEALNAFTQLHVQPQVEEALFVLVDAIQQGLVTATLLESVADFIRKADYNRRARYQPRFE
jgi:tetratricopeptide (TPR) repeat protein